MKRIALIFDFDGTVADTAQFMLEFANHLLSENGYPKISALQLESLRKMTILQGMRYLKIPLRLLPKGALRARQLMHDRLSDLRPCRGMVDTLKRLHQNHDILLGMVSSNSQANVEAFVTRFDLGGVFDFIDVGVSLFGKHLKLKQTLRRHQLEHASTYYIGDEVRDIEAAKKTGLKVIAVTWGLNHPEILARYSPNHLVSASEQIEDIVLKEMLIQ